MDFQKASFKVSKKGEQSYIGYLSQTKTIFNNKKIHPFLQAIIPTYISTQNFLLQTTRAPRKRNFFWRQPVLNEVLAAVAALLCD